VLLAELVGLPLVLRTSRSGLAFLVSATAIVAQVALVGISLYPNLVPSLDEAARSLTIANASSSEHTLIAMLVIALIGMPLVIGYTIFIYRTFRGKTRLGEDSY
jgi:cytochrome bd ubiquinol oxidase subunit II